ncbi:MAG TPA: hypothetical protein DCF68_21100, partial [Cyanothece sp. UBA12306]|nr:hypothetical protein [Cyanothece sp. UBA12306]
MKWLKRSLFLMLLISCCWGVSVIPALAHGFQTAYLDLREQPSGEIDVYWKTPPASGFADDGLGPPMSLWPIFTLAHSITLGAATLGWVNVPQAPVEAVIALSILFLASELAHSRLGKTGLTQQYPWLVALTFGLLHGFGFAGALAEVGLPPQDIPPALLFFNVGVEIGQLTFVLGVIGVMESLKRIPWKEYPSPFKVLI